MLIDGERYRLVEAVGQGGMGRVWRAQDELLGRQVAVKQLLISPHLDETTRQMLIRRATGEARTAAQLHHPGIVRVHDIIEHEGAPWIVMEFIDGPSLGALGALGTGGARPGLRRVAQIGAQVADALAHAHAAGVVHRDLKPDNVLMAGDRPVITDFGIALLLDVTARLTPTNSIIGTPQYMAPEQFQGREATGACDMWALGATLYTVLEGRAPFDGPTLAAIITAVLTEPLAPPRHAGPLAEILGALLAKDPALRPDAVAAAAMLREALRPAGEDDFICVLPPVPEPEPEPEPEPVPEPQRQPQSDRPQRPQHSPRPPRPRLSRRTLVFGGTGLAVAAAGGTAAALLLPGGGSPAAASKVSASAGTMPGFSGNVNSLAFSPDGKTIAAGCGDRNVHLWSVATGAPVATLSGHTDKVNAVAYSPDGKLIASGSDDATVRIWNAATGVAVTTISPGIQVSTLAFSADGKTLACPGGTGSLLLSAVGTGAEVGYLEAANEILGQSVAYSRDGAHLAGGCVAQSSVVLFKVPANTEEAVLTEPGSIVSGAGPVAFSPDSKTLATGISPSGTDPYTLTYDVQLFNVATHKSTAALSGHTDSVNTMAFSPDGATLASGSGDKTVRLWNIAAKKMTRVISVGSAVNSVAFSPDGTLLAVGSTTARLWSVA
jgi:serine/threonine protein kinase